MRVHLQRSYTTHDATTRHARPTRPRIARLLHFSARLAYLAFEFFACLAFFCCFFFSFSWNLTMGEALRAHATRERTGHTTRADQGDAVA